MNPSESHLLSPVLAGDVLSKPHSKPFHPLSLLPKKAFTLVELLMVVTVMAAMLVVAVPAFNTIKGSGDVTKAVYDIAGAIDQARTYAMANNTHVFVGFAEVDASADASAVPQKANTSNPYGRVAMVVVASKDGTSGYGSNLSNWSTSNTFPVSRLQHFENLHLAGNAQVSGTTGKLARPSAPTYQVTQVGDSSFQSATPLEWPVGSTNPQYQFKAVIEFDAQGVAWYQPSGGRTSGSMVQYFEIGLQPTHGNVVSASGAADVAVIQIDGMTGATRIYRP